MIEGGEDNQRTAAADSTLHDGAWDTRRYVEKPGPIDDKTNIFDVENVKTLIDGIRMRPIEPADVLYLCLLNKSNLLDPDTEIRISNTLPSLP